MAAWRCNKQGLRVVVIMDAIRHHPLQGKVLEEAIKALGTLALDSTHQKVLAHRSLLLPPKARRRASPYDAHDCGGCWWIWRRPVAGRQVIGRAGGIDLLIHAMQRHPRRTIIQVSASPCRARRPAWECALRLASMGGGLVCDLRRAVPSGYRLVTSDNEQVGAAPGGRCWGAGP